MKIALVLLLAALQAVTFYEQGALAQTSSALIEAGLDETYSVECYAFGDDGLKQKNYGQWDMQLHMLETLQLATVDSNTSEISCHFVWVSGNSTLHQEFAVYVASGLAFPCGDICHWTVYLDGFYLLNPATNLGTLMYEWLTGEDAWIPPS